MCSPEGKLWTVPESGPEIWVWLVHWRRKVHFTSTLSLPCQWMGKVAWLVKQECQMLQSTHHWGNYASLSYSVLSFAFINFSLLKFKCLVHSPVVFIYTNKCISRYIIWIYLNQAIVPYSSYQMKFKRRDTLQCLGLQTGIIFPKRLALHLLCPEQRLWSLCVQFKAVLSILWICNCFLKFQIYFHWLYLYLPI